MAVGQATYTTNPQLIYISSNYGNTWTIVNNGINAWQVSYLQFTYDESLVYYAPDCGYPTITFGYFYAISPNLPLIIGNGGGGGGMGSIGNSSGIGGTGTLIAISNQIYGYGGNGGNSELSAALPGIPGLGGGGKGGSYSYTVGGSGGSGVCVIYIPTSIYRAKYSSANPPNQTLDSSGNRQGGPSTTNTSVISFITNNTAISLSSGNPFSYTTIGHTTPLKYQNGSYIVSASSVYNTNYISYLFSTSAANVFSPNSANIAYTYNQITNISPGYIYGDWFQLQLPYSILISQYAFYTSTSCSPSSIDLLGSNDGVLFYILNTQTGLAASSSLAISIVSTTYFSIYRWIITANRSTSIATSIYNLSLMN